MAAREDPRHDAGPIQEPLQPDPYLREGPVGAWAKWAAAIAVAIIVCVVIYALNASGPEPQVGTSVQSATGSSAPSSSGATTGSGSK
jgi:hypothetical protein